MAKTKESQTCSDCGVTNCYRRAAVFPKFCLTKTTDPGLLEEVTQVYRGNGVEARMAYAAAEVEGLYYGKLTRAEEIVKFAQRIGASKIGLATCIGLMEETRIFVKILRANDLSPYTVICKVGSVDKSEIGIPDDLKIEKGSHEAICNPVLQAELMNRYKTDFNIIVGLCVGHDSLFIRHSNAPVTTLVTKDRVLCHNPAAALYGTSFYYKRLLSGEV